ncbi:MAG: hypothetical protein QM704_19060 [Anaeromyxobacteraceae bacterium]
MKRAAPLALLTLGLAACPLPQPLPDYSVGQTVTPPRIVVDDTVHKVTPYEAVVEVPAGCTGKKPTYDLQVYLRDSNTTETIVGRWFVNYTGVALSPSVVIQQADDIPAPPTNATEPDLRQSNVFVFSPYDRAPYGATGAGDSRSVGALNVVEYVVSNGFDTNNGNADVDRPNRRPAEATKTTPAFEVQVYRWVFLTVTPSATTACP